MGAVPLYVIATSQYMGDDSVPHHAIKNGLTKQQVLEVIEEVLC